MSSHTKCTNFPTATAPAPAVAGGREDLLSEGRLGYFEFAIEYATNE